MTPSNSVKDIRRGAVFSTWLWSRGARRGANRAKSKDNYYTIDINPKRLSGHYFIGMVLMQKGEGKQPNATANAIMTQSRTNQNIRDCIFTMVSRPSDREETNKGKSKHNYDTGKINETHSGATILRRCWCTEGKGEATKDKGTRNYTHSTSRKHMQRLVFRHVVDTRG